MNKYHIRFNHQHNGSGYVWRVFENGVEHLAKGLKIIAPVYDEITVEDGVEKWNIACNGYLRMLDGDIARIE